MGPKKPGRPPNRQGIDIETLKLQVRWGNKKHKLCQAHNISLYILNKLIVEEKMLHKLHVNDDYLKSILSLMITEDKETWGLTYVDTMFKLQAIYVPKNQLTRVLKELDPEASANRWALNISRIPQRYTAGPMHVWCIDAYCKLQRWGIFVYSIVDFASSAVMDIRAMRNIRPESVYISYQNALCFSKGINPWKIMLDQGGETVFIKMHQKKRLGLTNLIITTSTRNIEVERTHRSHFEKCSWFFIKLLTFLEDNQLVDIHNNIHIHSIFEVIQPAYQNKLDYWKQIRNNKKRRNQPKRNKPGGVPIEEFLSFFSTSKVGMEQYNQFKQDRWTYVDSEFDIYANTMRTHLRNYGPVAMDPPPPEWDIAKTYWLPGTKMHGETLTDDGIKKRNFN